MKTVDIIRETDGEDPGLPGEMPVPDGVGHECAADCLSGRTGWPVSGFRLEEDD